MKNKISFFTILFFLFLISCSSPNEPNKDPLSVEVNNSQLKITNNTDQTIYFFAVEQQSVSFINWAPHFNEPNIEAHSSININYSKIYNATGAPIKPGDKVIVNYWDSKDKDNPQISSILVTLK